MSPSLEQSDFNYLNFTQQSECIESIKTSVLYVDGKESMITLDYIVDPSKASDDFKEEGEEPAAKKKKTSDGDGVRYLHTQVIK